MSSCLPQHHAGTCFSMALRKALGSLCLMQNACIASTGSCPRDTCLETCEFAQLEGRDAAPTSKVPMTLPSPSEMGWDTMRSPEARTTSSERNQAHRWNIFLLLPRGARPSQLHLKAL